MTLACGCTSGFWSRRRALLALTGGAFLSGVSIPAVASEAPTAGTGLIDLHHHHGTPRLVEFLATHKSDRELPPVNWRVEDAIADMNAAGVERAILSQFAPYHLGSRPERRDLARSLNEAGAGFGRDHPGRFGLFATLPLPDIGDCLAEAAYGLDQLSAVGVAMVTSAGGKWLGDSYYYPLYDELDRRGAVVFVHPWTPDCCTGLVPGVAEYAIEYGTDTARAITSLIWSGTTTRYPNIKFIFSHCGGTAPFLIERLLSGTEAEVVPGIVTKGKSPPGTPTHPQNGTLGELRRMFYDTAQCSNPVALGALRKVVPPSQILYGSDFWYRTNVETVRGLRTSGVFDDAELRAIKRGNAEKLGLTR